MPAARAFFGSWDAAVYLRVLTLAFVYQASRRASIVMLLGNLIIAGFSLYCLYRTYRIAFLGNYSPSMMNCVGPIVELGLPLLPWPALMVFSVIAFVSSGDARREETPAN